MNFVIATFNPGKRRELERLLDSPGLTFESLASFPGASAPEERGATLEDNARIKARAAVLHTGRPAIADDTGLEVDALDGAPGVRSARFAGEGATDAENVSLLLTRLSGVDAERRTARFRCVCLASFKDGAEVLGVGVLEGVIAPSPRGASGFGYDPVFEPRGLGRTLAEIGADEKNELSHRAMAARDLLHKLAAFTR